MEWGLCGVWSVAIIVAPPTSSARSLTARLVSTVGPLVLCVGMHFLIAVVVNVGWCWCTP